MTPQSAFDGAVAAAVPSGPESEGFAAVSGGICQACHFPFQTSVVGAPDLSTVASRLSPTEMDEVLRDGRPELGMPVPVPLLTENDRRNVIAYLGWLEANRDDVFADWEARSSARDVDWSALPWWEFR